MTELTLPHPCCLVDGHYDCDLVAHQDVPYEEVAAVFNLGAVPQCSAEHTDEPWERRND